jgi:HD superfamily phosphohydrolase
VRQLGGCYYVYPSATHTRKEHSIGVAHLAGAMVRHLAKQQPDLEIDESDIMCVELAGLVHDLGHGPFSHMFEEFMHLADARGSAHTWEHEDMSAQLLRLLLEENHVPVAAYFDCSEQQAAENINFVVRLIEGLKDETPWPSDIGRSSRKRFLFDIVNNKRNGVDVPCPHAAIHNVGTRGCPDSAFFTWRTPRPARQVDKLDYLVRDSMAAFGSSSKVPGFDIYRIVASSAVLNKSGDPNQPQVCFQVRTRCHGPRGATGGTPPPAARPAFSTIVLV